MNVLVFITDIASEKDALVLEKFMGSENGVQGWTLDLNDRDKVLRVEADDYLDQSRIVDIVSSAGYHCAEMPDICPPV